MKYKIGEILFKEEKITINEEKDEMKIVVNNTGDRSIQICSHYHFFESNLALKFDREKALGMRLDIPSGTAVRFEPGEDKRVSLVPYCGNRKVIGFMGATMGLVDEPKIRDKAIKKMKKMEEREGK
ncbi:MAG: urease subunit beta [Anaerovoracaceae bacterium]